MWYFLVLKMQTCSFKNYLGTKNCKLVVVLVVVYNLVLQKSLVFN